MTTYTIAGFQTTTNSSGSVTAVVNADLNIVVPGWISTLSYTHNPTSLNGVNLADVSGQGQSYYGFTLGGFTGDYADVVGAVTQINWNDGTARSTYAAVFADTVSGAGQEYTFVIGGDALPQINTLADFATFRAMVTSIVNAPTGSGFAPNANISLAGIPGVTTSEADFAQGTDGPDTILTGDGDDSIDSGGGNDLIGGGAGNDTGNGGAGADEIYLGGGDDVGNGGDGPDVVGGGAGNDTLNGDAGNDALWGSGDNDVLNGGLGDDTLGGAAGDDILSGGEGADEIWGSFGNDTLNGGAGNDTIGGYFGDDSISGGDGDDELWSSDGNDTVVGGAGNDTLGGANGNDSLTGGGDNDELWGGAGLDTLDGGDGDDRIGAGTDDDVADGGAGNDQIFGGTGNDSLTGGSGDDEIYGASGNDTIEAGAGNDTVYGGSGADRHVITDAFDTLLIQEFSLSGGDLIDVSGTSLTFSDLTITGDATQTTISSALGTITLNNVNVATIDANAFFFASQKTDPTNSGSEDKVEITALGDGFSIQTNQGGSLIGMDEFRADSNYSSINGAGYTVVVIDTGIDLDHAAFGPDTNGDGVSDRIVYHEDFSNDRDGTANDVQGHGTNVASIVGSSEAGYLGIAPGVNIVALQALNNSGSGSATGIESALRWVIDNAAAYNIVAVNLSLGPGDNVNTPAANPWAGDEFQSLNDAGVIVTVAAGNDYFSYQTPGMSSIAADPNVISVGAVWAGDSGRLDWGSGAKDFTTASDRLTSFTQRSDDIDMVFAPGALIEGARPGGGFSSMGGTSQAAPMVAGVAALAQQIAQTELGRRLTPDEFHQLMISTSVSINDGDDEDDNVSNLGANLERIDMHSLAQAISALDGGNPPTPPATDDFAGDTTTTGTIVVDSSATGDIEASSDQDWFAVSLNAGDTYLFELKGSPTSDGTLGDPLMYIMDASGNVVTSNDDSNGSRNSEVEFTPQTGGTYYVSANGYGSSTGTYTASVTRTATAVVDDFAGDATTTSSISVNGAAATGELEVAGDRDWHAVTLEGSGEYTIDLTGDGASPLSDTYLRLYDSAGNLLATNDDGGEGLNSQLLYTATQGGTYYVSAGAYSDAGTGTYSVAVTGTTPGGSDVPDDASTNASVVVGGTYDGVLDFASDRDWVRVALTGGDVYDITLEGLGAGSLSDPYLRVYDSAGNLVDDNDDANGSLNSALESFSVTSTGTYFISAGAYGDYGTGDYQIAVTELSGGSGDIPSDDNTLSAVTPGSSVTSQIDFVGDRDWHASTLQAGHVYSISLEGTGTDPLGDTYLRVYDGSSQQVAFDDDGGSGLNSELVFTAAINGVYYLSAGAYGDRYESGEYTLTVTDLGTSDDFAGDSSTTGTIADNGSVTGDIETSGDRDWFAISVQSGAVYEFALQGSPTSQGTLSDTLLYVRDSVGNVLGYNDDGGTGRDSLLSFSAESSETIYLEAGGFATQTGTYTLTSTLISSGTDDHGNDTSTTSSVAVNGFSTGELEEEGDVDVFAITLQSGAEYSFTVDAGGSGGGTLSDSTLALLDELGNSLEFNDDGGPGLDSAISGFVASYSGTYYLSVEAFADSYTGTYSVSAVETAPPPTGDDFGDTPASAGSVSVGGTVNGELEEVGDRDWLAINLTGGDTFQFELTGTNAGNGTLSDPYLRIYDSTLSMVAFNDDSQDSAGNWTLDSRLDFSPTSSGTYYVEARAYNDGSEGTWQLDVDQIV